MAVTPAQKRRIKEEAGFRCAIPTCNATSPLEIHHITEVANDGSDDDDNLICLCRNCHGRYHDGEIPRISIQRYKNRVTRISTDLLQHEFQFLESLNQGQQIELDNQTINLARGLERRNLVRISNSRAGTYRLTLTIQGRQFIS